MEPVSDWVDGLDVAITICDATGKILSLNATAEGQYEKYGGRALIGKSLFDCHPDGSGAKLAALLAGQKPNHYTIGKNGRKRMIHQMPWFSEGRFAGLVEFAVEIPEALPHFERGGQVPPAG